MSKKKQSEPTRDMLLGAFGEMPAVFDRSVKQTLLRLTSEKEEPVVKRKMALAPALVLVIVLMAGVALAAALYPGTIQRFAQSYGADFGAKLEAGDRAEINTSYTLGEVKYTVTDVIWEGGVLYGTIVMEPEEGANIVLIPQDYSVDDPAGYAVYYGVEAPEGAKSYKELAQERGAKLMLATCIPDGFVQDGQLQCGTVGIYETPEEDGTIVASFELYGPVGKDFIELPIERAERYMLQLYLGKWEVTPEGQWLREEPNNTWQKAQWLVEVEPEKK